MLHLKELLNDGFKILTHEDIINNLYGATDDPTTKIKTEILTRLLKNVIMQKKWKVFVMHTEEVVDTVIKTEEEMEIYINDMNANILKENDNDYTLILDYKLNV